MCYKSLQFDKLEGRAKLTKARVGLSVKMARMEAVKEDKLRRRPTVSVPMAHKYHPKIIGRKGAIITKLRDDYRVKIKIPQKNVYSKEVITITGLAEDAKAAKTKILKIVQREVSIDTRVNSRILARAAKMSGRSLGTTRVTSACPGLEKRTPPKIVVSGGFRTIVL